MKTLTREDIQIIGTTKALEITKNRIQELEKKTNE
jgi:hypothetical protein